MFCTICLFIDLFPPPYYAAVQEVLNRIISYPEPDIKSTLQIKSKALLERLADPEVVRVQCTLLFWK